MKRAFTRGDIEDWFIEYFGKSYAESGDTVKIGEVLLLQGAGQPLWIIDYTIISPGTYGSHRYYGKLILTQEKLLASDGWCITFPEQTALPPGCPSVAEEDKAIKAEAEKAEQESECHARVETAMAD